MRHRDRMVHKYQFKNSNLKCFEPVQVVDEWKKQINEPDLGT